MTVVFPEFVTQQGNTSVVAIQGLTALGALSLANDINDPTSLNISCYLFSGGVGSENTNKGNRPKRACSKRELQAFGTSTLEVTDLVYGYSPQAPADDPANAAKTALTPGTKIALALRMGLDVEEDPFAVGDVADLWYVELGPQNKTMTGDGEFDEYTITQPVVAYRDPDYDVVVAA